MSLRENYFEGQQNITIESKREGDKALPELINDINTNIASNDSDISALQTLMSRTSNIFISTEQTGTGAAQNIAHTLVDDTGTAVAPVAVLVAVTDDTAVDGAGGYSIVEGVHTDANVIVTVTTGVKFKVLAIY